MVHTGCEEGEFRCDNAVCVPQSYVCDQVDDCGDHSDEEQTCRKFCMLEITSERGQFHPKVST